MDKVPQSLLPLPLLASGFPLQVPCVALLWPRGSLLLCLPTPWVAESQLATYIPEGRTCPATGDQLQPGQANFLLSRGWALPLQRGLGPFQLCPSLGALRVLSPGRPCQASGILTILSIKLPPFNLLCAF